MDTNKVIGCIDDYVDQLDDELRNIEKLELREDEGIHNPSLANFRDWILKNPDILKCRLDVLMSQWGFPTYGASSRPEIGLEGMPYLTLIDSTFLLRFLRNKKFSIPLAQELLMKYLTSRMILTELQSNLDCLDPSVKKLYDSGIIYMLKGGDDHGRRIMHIQYGRVNPETTTSLEIIRALFIAVETLIDKGDCQISGISYITDYTDAGISFFSLWSPAIVQRMLTAMIKSHPARHKLVYFTNLPSSFKWFFKLFRRFTGEKMKKRFVLQESGTKFEDLVPIRMLPKEYGGSEHTLQELIDLWKEELLESRPRLLQLDELAVSEYCKVKRESELYQNKDLGCDGSFRKLQID